MMSISAVFSVIQHDFKINVKTCGGNQIIYWNAKTNQFRQMSFQEGTKTWTILKLIHNSNLEQETFTAWQTCRTRHSGASCVPAFPVASFPWLLWPHRFLQGASCHGNAFQSIVLLTAQEGRCPCNKRLYLFICFARRTRWRPQRRRHAQGFCKQQKVGRRDRFWKQACGAPGGCKWRRCSSHVCAVLRCPHLRQTHVVLIHHLWMDSFTLPLSWLFIHPISPTLAPIPASLTAVFLSFTIHITFFYISHIPWWCLCLFFVFSPLFVSAEHINLPSILPWNLFLWEHHNCHYKIYYLPLMSHCFERVLPKMSLFQRCVIVYVFVVRVVS